EKLISKYLNRSFCFEATYNNELLGVLILLPTHPETLEVVNIAVISTQRNKGIGHQLLTFAEKYARNNNYKCLEIGTGTTSFGQLYLYQKCDFRVVGVDQNFFTIHYDK
ncbi:GNAT family N-acetyltransferase, partial [Weissella cibaria]